MRAARTYARRDFAPAEFPAPLGAVEAKCETRCGHPHQALRPINHAEHTLSQTTGQTAPDWFKLVLAHQHRLIQGRHPTQGPEMNASWGALRLPEEQGVSVTVAEG
ncbi:hypothetical protein [Actinomadura chokoriensis]|uniref:hypothetical protein n=1 Tax=Actinomadura chokoriensis TaxID=454156 RepID=UPI0031F89CC3